jgi:microcystin-dependent protein
MALNFPPVDSTDGNPTDGLIWSAPNGQQWIYRADGGYWESVAATGNSNIVYRGSIDLTIDPNIQYNDIEAGNQFTVTVGASPVDDSLYPGLGGKNVSENSLTIYDGNRWQAITDIPYATETVPGVVELATQSEAQTGSNNLSVLTPLRGSELVDAKILQASTTNVGKTRYATKTETDNGVETEAALTPASIADILDRLANVELSSIGTGVVQWFAGVPAAIPSGWLFCNGQTITREPGKENLYDLLVNSGNPYSSNPNAVQVPDLRGIFIRGYDPRLFSDGGRNPDNTRFGGYQIDQWRSHTHGVSDPGHRHSISGNGYSASTNSPNEDVIVDNNLGVPRNSSTNTASTGISIQSNGGNETRSKNVNMTPIIKL